MHARFVIWLLSIVSVCTLTSVSDYYYEHLFTSFQFENNTMHTFGKKFEISAASKVSVITNQICTNFRTWNSFDCAICVNNIHYHKISNNTAFVLNTANDDRYDFSVMVLRTYYELLVPQVEKYPTVCLFGDYSTHVLYSMLQLNWFKVLYFNDTILQTNIITSELIDLLFLFSDRIELITSPLDVFIDNINIVRSLSNQESASVCDIIHVRGDSLSITDILYNINRIINNNVTSLPVMWERYCMDCSSFPSQVDWIVNGLWYVGSFSVTDNALPLRCGLAKLYSLNETISNVWLGFTKEERIDDNVCTVTKSVIDYHYILTFTDFIFLETALGLKHALHLIGISESNIHVMGLLNLTMVDNLRRQHEPMIQIAIGPHHPTLLLKNYIVFHTENMVSAFLYLNTYGYLMQNAKSILLYASYHQHFIKSLYKVHEDKIFVVPFYSRSPYLEEARSTAISDYIPQVYFYGTPSTRRDAYANRLVDFCIEKNISILTSQMSGVAMNHPYDIRTKEWYIQHSRVIVSIHSYGEEQKIVLETHRINHLLSLGKIVITEPSIDAELDEEYADAIILVNQDEMMNVIEDLLKDEERMKRMEARALEKYKEISSNVYNLELAIQHAVFESNQCNIP